MNMQHANAVASIFGGKAYQSGGNIWLVKLTNSGGNLVVFDGESVMEYADEEAFERGDSIQAIALA